MGEGARIELQPQARLSLSSSQQLDVHGTLVSHGGSISLSTQATDPSRPALAPATAYYFATATPLAAVALLLMAGVWLTLRAPDRPPLAASAALGVLFALMDFIAEKIKPGHGVDEFGG